MLVWRLIVRGMILAHNLGADGTMTNKLIRRFACVAMVCVALLITACGNRNRDEGAVSSAPVGNAGAAAVPTMPSARFAMPTSMIGATGSQTTAVEASDGVTETVMTEAEATETPQPSAAPEVDLTRGQTIYANRNCAECHGEQGEGVAEKGSALAATGLGADDFSDVMRTGRGIGPDHIYGPSVISPGGMDAMYAWLQSLPPAP